VSSWRCSGDIHGLTLRLFHLKTGLQVTCTFRLHVTYEIFRSFRSRLRANQILHRQTDRHTDRQTDRMKCVMWHPRGKTTLQGSRIINIARQNTAAAAAAAAERGATPRRSADSVTNRRRPLIRPLIYATDCSISTTHNMLPCTS